MLSCFSSPVHFLGLQAAGKSNLIYTIVGDEFEPDHIATEGLDTKITIVELNEDKIDEIWKWKESKESRTALSFGQFAQELAEYQQNLRAAHLHPQKEEHISKESVAIHECQRELNIPGKTSKHSMPESDSNQQSEAMGKLQKLSQAARFVGHFSRRLSKYFKKSSRSDAPASTSSYTEQDIDTQESTSEHTPLNELVEFDSNETSGYSKPENIAPISEYENSSDSRTGPAWF